MTPVLLLIDWDSTLTFKDTLSTVASIGYKCSNIKSKPWSTIVDEYLADFQKHKVEYQPSKSNRNTIESELTWLSSLYPIERQSFCRFKDQGLSNSVTKAKLWRETADAIRNDQVQLRPGWDGLFNWNINSNHVPISIISVGWSCNFIQACLLHAAESQPGNNRLINTLTNLPIYANEIYPFESGINPNEPGIHTGEDKLHVLQNVCNKFPNSTVVYVGDSISDLHCLLKADIGICIRDESMSSTQTDLAETLERIGIPIKPLVEFKPERYKPQIPIPKILWWSSNLNDIPKVLEIFI